MLTTVRSFSWPKCFASVMAGAGRVESPSDDQSRTTRRQHAEPQRRHRNKTRDDCPGPGGVQLSHNGWRWPLRAEGLPAVPPFFFHRDMVTGARHSRCHVPVQMQKRAASESCLCLQDPGLSASRRCARWLQCVCCNGPSEHSIAQSLVPSASAYHLSDSSCASARHAPSSPAPQRS
jgi:hypothetical protein